MPHLLVAISGHGYGHFAQVAPVINGLAQRIPKLRLTLQTAVPEALLHERIQTNFELLPEAPDVTVIMRGPTEIDWPATIQAHQSFHRNWREQLAVATNRLTALAPDLVLADIPYPPLAAAQAAGIPNMALCSLNWADILDHHPQARQTLAGPITIMRKAYAKADAFLLPAPSMPMNWLDNRVTVGPIATTGRERRAELFSALGLNEPARLIMVSLGGIPIHQHPRRWPQKSGWHWLLPSAWRDSSRPDQHAWDSLDWPFSDLLHSVDLVITKPGYGTFVEAACAGIPVLYAERNGWAESPWLERWLARHQPCRALSLDQLLKGDIESSLQQLLAEPRRPAIMPSGVDEACDRLAVRLKP